MHAMPMRPQPLALWHEFTRWVAGALVALVLVLFGLPAHAATPAAGASIENQASATYSDGSGVSRTVTSNKVTTVVTQVYSLTLVQNGAQTATPGSVVYYPHTLTNTGNGADTFNLAATSTAGTFTMTNIEIFADNGSGQPTGSAITSSGVLNAGATFKFIVRGTVPTSAVATNTNTITVTATSVGDNTKNASNTDVTTVTGNAVITVTKAIAGATSGPAGTGGIEYTLTYTNTGNSTATNVKLTDVLPAGMEMTSGSGRWSVTGSTALSQTGGSVGTAPNTLTSTYTAATRTFEATIAQVNPGQSGTVRFTVAVASTVAPGVLNNTANVEYGNGGTPAATVTGNSNTVAFTVTQTAGVTFTGPTAVPSAGPGSVVSFTNTLTNTGNGTDTFNITIGTSTFPAGTTFQLYKSDGATPLVNTNSGDAVVDTGPIPAGGTYSVILQATLPPTASGTGPFSVNKTATSVFDPSKSATATDTLTSITPASVDLTNNAVAASGVPGFGAGPGSAAQVTNSTNPGTTTVFTLVVNNTGPAPDSYNLTAGSTAAGGSLPSGWTVEFRHSVSNSCAAPGSTLTNTGSIASGGNGFYCAVVSVPAGYAAGTQPVYFRATSPTSGATDPIWDAVTVNAVRAISLTPNGTGQTFPGGQVVYTHVLTNNGNVDEGGTLSTLTPAVPQSGGWSSTLYIDTNNDGQLDAGDTLVTSTFTGTLAKGASVTVFHRVIAPSGAVPGDVNSAVITVTTTNGSYTTTVPAPTVATDSTTVIAGNLTLNKVQALDANCDGTADGAYGQGNLAARPGQCVLYRITVTNVGAADATNVVVSDSTPTYTKISTAAATTSGNVTAPAVGASGSIVARVGTGATTAVGGTLAAAASVEITFGVKIDE